MRREHANGFEGEIEIELKYIMIELVQHPANISQNEVLLRHSYQSALIISDSIKYSTQIGLYDPKKFYAMRDLLTNVC